MMNKQEILKKIGNIIQELSEQQQYLSNTQKINILELELFTANADFLIDHIEILKKLSNHQEPEEQPVKAPLKEEVKKQEPEVEAKEPEMPAFKFSLDEPTEMVFDFEKKLALDAVFDRELTPEEHELIAEKQKQLNEKLNTEVSDTQEEEAVGPEPFLVTKQEEEPKQQVKEEPKPIEVFSESAPLVQPIAKPENKEQVLSLNDMLSAQSGSKATTSSSLSGNATITDLKSSISLNDKIMFIKELFNGYNLAYSEAIEILNRFDSFEAADNFLMKNYAEKNSWASKQDIVDRFYDILNRKFKK